MNNNNKVVVFADVLGFATLTESYPLDVDSCMAGDRPLEYIFSEIFKPSYSELSRIFSNFHSSLRGVLNLAKMHHHLTAITFSDSVFVATSYAYESINIAINLLHSLLPQKIPVRMGIAYGTFAAIRFRSDITSDGGDHAAQFLGTAVVRAHNAEACGVKGLRILLHPSVIPLLNDIHHNPKTKVDQNHALRYLECSEIEKLNKYGICHEIDYWHLKKTMEAKAWHGLQDMWNEAPLVEQEHFKATAEAINRMRVAQGYDSLDKLRRRTLP
jgi:hypothetical protein